jgi:hypothetical protein
MSNPYFPTSPPFNYNDYGLTVFRPDMVLTHEQLNMLFGFLLGEERRTRTRLIGVGIVCGLEPKLNNNNTITISRGCGVTSEGDLICLETPKTYTGFLPYILTEHAPYAPFNAIPNLKLWELFPPEYDTIDIPNALNTFVNLSNMVVMLYLESQVKDADDCTGVSCDNKGDVFNNRLRVLLVSKTDAAALIERTHQEAMMACSRLPSAPSRRVHLDSLPYGIGFKRFQIFVRNMSAAFSSQLSAAYTIVQSVLNEVYNTSPVPQWQTMLNTKITHYSANTNIQYLYDWLKDLFDAYNEFREAACKWLVACAPPESAFPKHLLLGEFSAGCPPSQYRHRFIQSPTVGTDAKQKALWLFDRIGQLIEGFEIPDLRRRLDISLLIKITPSRTRETHLGDRAMPFYYKPDTKRFWSYDKMRQCRTDEILSFHLPDAPAPHVANPFLFDIEKLPFYRIEGILNENLLAVLTTVQNLRAQHNLSFDIVALRADAQQRLFITDGMFNFIDLEREFDDVLDEIHCLMAALTPIKTVPTGGVGSVGGTVDTTKAKTTSVGGVSKVILNKDRIGKVFIERATSYIDLVINTAALATLAPKNPQRFVDLRMSYAEFSKVILGLQTALKPRLPKTTVECILDKLVTLDKIKKAYDARIKQIEDSFTFSNYLSKHPGIEHAAGVPRSGTIIFVYTSNAIILKTRAQPIYTVVADFYLPYLCCGGSGGINIQLPEPPPTITIAKSQVCVGNTPIPITVSPEGGQITDETGKVVVGTNFTPSVAGSHTLTYTHNGKTASVNITVLPLPVAQFNFDQLGNGLTVLFVNQSTNVTEVTWDFGDGSTPRTIALSATEKGNIEHTYQFDRVQGRIFDVSFTVSNGSCNSFIKKAVAFPAVVPVAPIKLTLDSVICFNNQVLSQVKSDPEGGVFTTPNLKIDKIKGAFLPIIVGQHTITYTLGERQATIETFIIPIDFKVENPRRDRATKRAIIDIVLPTPPAILAYVWLLDGKLIKTVKETIEGVSTRHLLDFPLDFQGGSLTLLFQREGKEFCNKITHGFEIAQP